jgi:hypothetical protein
LDINSIALQRTRVHNTAHIFVCFRMTTTESYIHVVPSSVVDSFNTLRYSWNVHLGLHFHPYMNFSPAPGCFPQPYLFAGCLASPSAIICPSHTKGMASSCGSVLLSYLPFTQSLLPHGGEKSHHYFAWRPLEVIPMQPVQHSRPGSVLDHMVPGCADSRNQTEKRWCWVTGR